MLRILPRHSSNPFEDNPEIDSFLPLSSEQAFTDEDADKIELTTLNEITDAVKMQLVPCFHHSDTEEEEVCDNVFVLNKIDKNITDKPKKHNCTLTEVLGTAQAANRGKRKAIFYLMKKERAMAKDF
ncbi:unnamed protein product [Hermetia illucens]|uniref:Uncharacterized protein n=1 Tax=Hermetia illucens TaxID=343691 RepID=A0A7R8UCM5_HERIL|nr:unnamed protein product [Hermetia illucens]